MSVVGLASIPILLTMAACATDETPLNPFGKPYIKANVIDTPVRLPCDIEPGDRPPITVFGSKPLYPITSLLNGKEGLIKIRVAATEEGNIVVRSYQYEGNPAMVDHALIALRDWKVKPALRNGQPVEVLCEIEFWFAIKP